MSDDCRLVWLWRAAVLRVLLRILWVAERDFAFTYGAQRLLGGPMLSDPTRALDEEITDIVRACRTRAEVAL